MIFQLTPVSFCQFNMILPVAWEGVDLNLPMFSTHWNQLTDLLQKWIDWFLCDWNIGRQRVKTRISFHSTACFKYERRVLSRPIGFSGSNSICEYLCNLQKISTSTNTQRPRFEWYAFISMQLPILEMSKWDALHNLVPFVQF